MKLYKTYKWYNPFTVDASGKAYELSDIIFFDEDGGICRTGYGRPTLGDYVDNKH